MNKSSGDFFDESIFNNVGEKIQLFAKILFVLNIIRAIVFIIFFYRTYLFKIARVQSHRNHY